MVWINNGKASRRGGEPVRASRSFSPTSVSPILQAAFPLTLFDEITSSGSSVGSLPISGKTNPTCPSLILLPPFLTCCLKFFHLLHHLLFMQSYVCLSVPVFLPRVPPLNRLWWEWQAPLVGEQRCALWLALECCYDSNRKSPLCSSPHSHQCCSSQRVSLAWLHTQQHQGSSNPPGRRQLSCNGSCTFPPPARLPHCSVCWLRAKKNLHWEKLSGSLNF